MAETQYNDATIKLTLRVLTEKGFDCGELLVDDKEIDWHPIAQALCRRYFYRSEGHIWDTPFISFNGNIVQHILLDYSKECDWLKVFEAVFARLDDAAGCEVKLPMHSTMSYASDRPSEHDVASLCWRDGDEEVIRLVLEKGGSLMRVGEEVPAFDRIEKDALLNWCSGPVCDLVFEHMGWSYADIDYSVCDWPATIRTTGNLHTFEIVRQYAPEKLDLSAFNLNNLFKEQRFEIFRAVLRASENQTVKSQKAKVFILAFAEENDVDTVGLMLEKVVFSKKASQDIVASLEDKADQNDADGLILSKLGSAQAVKPKKLTMTECFKEAQIGAETANPEKIKLLVPYAAKVKADKVVDLLERAAAFGDKTTIKAIFDLFGEPEFLPSALCIAIRNGNEETARALRAKGASLLRTKKKWDFNRKYTRDHLLEDDIFVKSAVSGRIDRFFVFAAPEAHPEGAGYIRYGEDTPGECFHREQAHELIRKLFESGVLVKADAGALGYELLTCGDLDLAISMFEHGVPLSKRSALLAQLVGTTIDEGFDGVADYVYQNVEPGDLVERFKVVRGYLTAQNHAALARCVRHLPADAVKPTDTMWKALAEGGYFDEILIACDWGQCTKSDLEIALAIVSEYGKPGVTAIILEKLSAEGNAGEANPLEL